jgi:hypothetical protein
VNDLKNKSFAYVVRLNSKIATMNLNQNLLKLKKYSYIVNIVRKNLYMYPECAEPVTKLAASNDYEEQ